MLSPSGETQTKRLLNQYEKLKTEGVPESELVEKTVSAVESDRVAYQETKATKITPQNPDSVTSQVLTNAFSEK